MNSIRRPRLLMSSEERFPQPHRTFYGESDGLPSDRIHALARWSDEVWAGGEAGISRFEDGGWRPCTEDDWPQGRIEKLFTFESGTAVAAGKGDTWVYGNGGWGHAEEPGRLVGAAEDQSGCLWALASDGLWQVKGGEWDLRKSNSDDIEFNDFIWLKGSRGVAASRDGLFFLQGKRPYWYIVQERQEGLLSNRARSVSEDANGHIWVATDRGISIYMPPNGWCSLTGEEGLPIEDLSGVEIGVDGTIWLSSLNGLIRLRDGRWKYYASKRYLPSDLILDMLPGDGGDIWAATDDGVSHIEFDEMTLEQKAEHYAELTERHHKRRGYVTIRWLESPGDLDTGYVEISDNDGTWTGLYLAAQCFRYAVTKSKDVKELISGSLQAMLDLERVTGIPGLPARSVRKRGEHGFGDGHPEFHRTPDGETEWKGDTSSDEIDAHFFALSICHDLGADDEERGQIEGMVSRVMDYIIENDYLLIDQDGEPTTWGVWSPSLLNDDDKWRMQRGLNSLEILSHLKTAHHITGNERYLDEYMRLIKDHHYALNTIKQRITILGQHTWHDDELAMLSYYPLLLYERDSALRQLFLTSLERTWRDLRQMRYPLWNFIYRAVTGRGCQEAMAMDYLVRLPLDLVRWTVKNSLRADIQRDPDDPSLARVPIDADERPIEGTDGCQLRLDGGRDGMVAQDGTIYLLPYWMGRYHGFIQ